MPYASELTIELNILYVSTRSHLSKTVCTVSPKKPQVGNLNFYFKKFLNLKILYNTRPVGQHTASDSEHEHPLNSSLFNHYEL